VICNDRVRELIGHSFKRAPFTGRVVMRPVRRSRRVESRLRALHSRDRFLHPTLPRFAFVKLRVRVREIHVGERRERFVRRELHTRVELSSDAVDVGHFIRTFLVSALAAP
jgi:hypothetical protein